MKKRILITLLCLFSVTALLLSIDFHSYRKQSKTVSSGSSDLLLTITTFDGESESQPFVSCLGHTWLSLENQTDHTVSLKGNEIAPGEQITFSVWAISNHRGVVFNLESRFIEQFDRYRGRQSLSVGIEEAKLATIEEYLDQNDSWTLGNNCSHWSIRLWNQLVEESDRLPAQTLIYTPARLQKAFSEFDCVELDKGFSGASEIFFYQNGQREELKLCS